MNEEFHDQEKTTSDGEWISGSAGDFNSSQSAAEQAGPDTDQSTYEAGQEKKPVNMVTGIVGAFLGILVGVVLWVIIYQMGYIAGIAGFVMMICAFKGFELLGGRVNIDGFGGCLFCSQYFHCRQCDAGGGRL